MVEKAKKTTAASEPSKLKKVSVRKPKTTPKKENKETAFSPLPTTVNVLEMGKENYSCKRINFQLLVLCLLLVQLILGIWILIKISHLQKGKSAEVWGKENYQRLETLYATPEYQEYAKGQIDSLEQQIKIMNPKAE